MTLKLLTGDSEVKEAPSDSDRDSARRLVDEYLRETTEAVASKISLELRPADYEAGRMILEAPSTQQAIIVVDAAMRLAKYGTLELERYSPLRPLVSAVLRKKPPFDQTSIEQLLQMIRDFGSWWILSMAGTLRAVELHVDQHGIAEFSPMRSATSEFLPIALRRISCGNTNSQHSANNEVGGMDWRVDGTRPTLRTWNFPNGICG